MSAIGQKADIWLETSSVNTLLALPIFDAVLTLRHRHIGERKAGHKCGPRLFRETTLWVGNCSSEILCQPDSQPAPRVGEIIDVGVVIGPTVPAAELPAIREIPNVAKR